MPIKTKTLRTWDEIHQYANAEFREPGWLFRGQRDAKSDLKTSLERFFTRQGVSNPVKRRNIEDQLFREFRRVYHHYARHDPRGIADLEWLSLMQHHGAPTRLLDFTYSIYIAAYFGLEKAEGDSAIWAVRYRWALDESTNLFQTVGRPDAVIKSMKVRPLEGDGGLLESLCWTDPYVCSVWPRNPFHLNERLQIQRGAFLIPTDISETFMYNLMALSGWENRRNVRKIIIRHSQRGRALRNLFDMGISRTSLFPGLDGFAQSLGVYNPVVLNPVKLE